jgi:hypothetical protein
MRSSCGAVHEKSKAARVRQVRHPRSFLKYFLISSQFFATNHTLMKPREMKTAPATSVEGWLTRELKVPS